MPTFEYCGRRIEREAQESVLDALLRAGETVGHSCRAGRCRACLVRAVDGNAPAHAQEGLDPARRERGLFLACLARPEDGLRVGTLDALGLDVAATLEAVERLSHDVVRVRLRTDVPFDFRAGQFVTLLRADGLARSYSTASVPHTSRTALELHVREVAHGVMSRWLAHEAQIGTRVSIRGPDGDCYYVPGRPEQPLLLIGTGTGLAPLVAFANDALAQGHRGRIALVHGARDERGLYFVDELDRLAREHANVELTRCLVEGEARQGVEIGLLADLVRRRFSALRGWRVVLCGHPELVFDLKKRVFLAGASSTDIHADAFVTRPVATVA